MFQLPEIQAAHGGLANVEGWAKNGGVWKQSEKVGKECILWQKSEFRWEKKIDHELCYTEATGVSLRYPLHTSR